MIYRFFVALIFTLLVFPFAAMYTFSVSYSEAQFAFDKTTWLSGLMVIGFGWVIFLLPGLLPFVGHRYYDWAAETLGFVALFQAIRNGALRIRDRIRWLHLRARTALSSIPSPQQAIGRLKRKSVESSPDVVPPLELEDEVDPQPKVPKRRIDIKSATTEQLSRAREVLHDTPKHLAKAKDTISSIKQKLTPDELQRTIDLNQYTLETFSHVKSMLWQLVRASDLGAEELAFCRRVVDAVPQPPSPSAVTKAPPSDNFSYPLDRRESLRVHAATKKITLRDKDFQLAEEGDLERAFLIMKALLVERLHQHSVAEDENVDDLMLGLPISQST